MVDAIKELEEAKRKLISVEDTLLLISQKFNIDRVSAATNSLFRKILLYLFKYTKSSNVKV